MPTIQRTARPSGWPPIPALVLLLLAGGVGLAGTARADVVETRDGRRLVGTVVEESEASVVIDTRAGRVTVVRKDVKSVTRSKSTRAAFEERFEESRDDIEGLLFVAEWCEGVEYLPGARKCMRRVLALDDQHDGANEYLGNVKYAGEWMTPKQAERRREKDELARRKAEGLVEYEGRWVKPEVKAKLERGLVLFEGEWITYDEMRARQGFVRLRLSGGSAPWVTIPIAEAAARARAVASGAEVLASLAPSVGPSADHVVLGPWPEAFLVEISDGMDRARALFDGLFADVPPGIALLGGAPAEFYVWERDSRPYHDTTDVLAERTSTVGEAWRQAVKETHGWVFWDPTPVSSVRAVARPDSHLAGHSYYHWGHVLLNRHRYDGRLLPPWFGEGFASLVEWWTHGQNTVVLKAGVSGTEGGSVARGKEPPFGRAALTRGDWLVELRRALEEKDRRLVPLEKLAAKAPGELTAVDVAMSMGIVLWLQREGARQDLGGLDAFHRGLKETAPAPPDQVFARVPERRERYDAAFEAALGLDTRAADRAWRAWFLASDPDELAELPEPSTSEAGATDAQETGGR